MRLACIEILVVICHFAYGEKSEKTENKGCINVKETEEGIKIENRYAENANTKKEDVVEDITLPVPPKVRSSRGPSRLEILKSDENFLIPKYVRLPVVDGVKVRFSDQIKFHFIAFLKQNMIVLNGCSVEFAAQINLQYDKSKSSIVNSNVDALLFISVL